MESYRLICRPMQPMLFSDRKGSSALAALDGGRQDAWLLAHSAFQHAEVMQSGR